MRRIALLLVAVVALAGVLTSLALLYGQVDGEVAPREGQPQAGGVAMSRDDLASKLARREVQRSPSSIPGREIVQVETLIPAGVESGWHAHPGEEVGYIIAGQVEMMVQGRATVVPHAGDGFLIHPRTLIMRATSARKPSGCCRLMSSRQASRSRRSWTNPFRGRAFTQYPAPR
jgi:quercetin dioxygenase-like cupin family protein